MNAAQIPNKKLWMSVFNEMFKDLNKKELAVHAKLLFGVEYRVHQIFATSWLKCRKCKKKWHSFKGTVEFMYGLKKEGKPKRRLGRVTMVPYGQQCKICSQKSQKVEKNEDEEESVEISEELFWLPWFDEETIRETLTEVYEIIEKKYYESSHDRIFKTHGKISRSKQKTMSGKSNPTHQNHVAYSDVVEQYPIQVFHPSNQFNTNMFLTFPQPQIDDGMFSSISLTDPNIVDDEGDSVIGDHVGDGPHESSLCEACSKGKCRHQDSTVSPNDEIHTSGRQSRRGDEHARVSKPPRTFGDDLPDDVSSTINTVKWNLRFENV